VPVTHDAIVIGAGLAGLLGGLRLAEAGRDVLLLAKGHGATHWAAGTIGVADGAVPLAAVERLARERPEHPYARAGVADLQAAVARLRDLCAAADYPLTGALDRNTRLPTAAGALREAALFPATMAAGDATLPGPVLVAGFRELRDFYPALVAANLAAQGIAARGVYLDLPPRTSRRLDFTPTTFARLFAEPIFRAEIGRQLRAARGDAARIALPAVLGLDMAGAVVADLATMAGRPVYEIPTLPVSVPGSRLYAILAAAFRRAGGRLQVGGWVTRGEGAGRRLDAVYTEAAAREQRHAAHSFLLATGGIAGGGLRAEQSGRVVETALGLPVRAPAGRGDWFAPHFLAPAGHPLYRAGIATDADLRPLDTNGAIVYENVAVAGAALGGADLLREGCYEGVALATGWRAAGALLGETIDDRR
ncbi:MAG TPA: glycerol-3-phosphate dehydrogenase subunit GlpB, partial [Thermomicrobiales bacterium]|nr:glycerol-3-phosphate dehydrogenase subunit GlpB [Thermomicrobiales bacterium]